MGLETDSETPLSPPDRRPPKKTSNDSTLRKSSFLFYSVCIIFAGAELGTLD